MEVVAPGRTWIWSCHCWFSWMLTLFQTSFRRLMLWIIRAGPIPTHIAIIMDGNRRFAQRHGMEKKSGHEFGAESLMQTLKHCYELGVQCVTIYAFSIENFKRSREEVDALMDLMQQRLEAILDKDHVLNQHGIRVRLIGNLELLPERVRKAADKVMVRTMVNDRATLNVCVAYTSTEEIAHAVQGACLGFGGESERLGFEEEREKEGRVLVSVEDIERGLYTAGFPEPDLLIRTSGETRLSNFLLWQSGFCYLHACGVLWPEFSFRHLFMSILSYQRAYPYLNSSQRLRGLKGSFSSDL